jgi:hypothetical protein
MHFCKKKWNRVNAELHYTQLPTSSPVILKKRRSYAKYDAEDLDLNCRE